MSKTSGKTLTSKRFIKADHLPVECCWAAVLGVGERWIEGGVGHTRQREGETEGDWAMHRDGFSERVTRKEV